LYSRISSQYVGNNRQLSPFCSIVKHRKSPLPPSLPPPPPIDYYLRCRRCRRDSELLPGHQDVHNTQFFNSFHDPLAQIVYFSLRAAYPLSRAALDLQFKRRLLRTLSNWTTGLLWRTTKCNLKEKGR
jgi:hypothetical protein